MVAGGRQTDATVTLQHSACQLRAGLRDSGSGASGAREREVLTLAALGDDARSEDHLVIPTRQSTFLTAQQASVRGGDEGDKSG